MEDVTIPIVGPTSSILYPASLNDRCKINVNWFLILILSDSICRRLIESSYPPVHGRVPGHRRWVWEPSPCTQYFQFPLPSSNLKFSVYKIFLVGHLNLHTKTPWSGFWVPDFVSIASPGEGGGRLELLFILIVPFDFYLHCSSVAKSCLSFCNPMECSMPGFPVLPDISEFAQTHVHWVSDAIQPSYPLSFASPLAFNLSQHHVIFPWVDSLYQMARVLDLQHQSFQWIFRIDFL